MRMTQFKEVRLGEKRAHQSLLMTRNSNTSRGSDLLAAKEDPLMIKWPRQTTKILHTFNKHLMSSSYVFVLQGRAYSWSLVEERD